MFLYNLLVIVCTLGVGGGGGHYYNIHVWMQSGNLSGKQGHKQLMGKCSSTGVSACWATVDWPRPKGWNWCTQTDSAGGKWFVESFQKSLLVRRLCLIVLFSAVSYRVGTLTNNIKNSLISVTWSSLLFYQTVNSFTPWQKNKKINKKCSWADDTMGTGKNTHKKEKEKKTTYLPTYLP